MQQPLPTRQPQNNSLGIDSELAKFADDILAVVKKDISEKLIIPRDGIIFSVDYDAGKLISEGYGTIAGNWHMTGGDSTPYDEYFVCSSCEIYCMKIYRNSEKNESCEFVDKPTTDLIIEYIENGLKNFMSRNG